MVIQRSGHRDLVYAWAIRFALLDAARQEVKTLLNETAIVEGDE